MKYQENSFFSGLMSPEDYRRWYEAQRTEAGARCALILAGGRSSRMGRDKALERLEGETMLERAVRFWRESGRVDAVLAAVGQPGHLEPLPQGVTAIPDLIEGRGPLAGIWSAFQSTRAELLYVSAVDMPNLTAEAILPPPKGDAAVYRRAGRPEPLFGVYRRSVAPVAERLLKNGVGKMSALLEAVDTEYHEIPPQQARLFDNLNTPRDLLLARAGTPPMVAVMGWSGSGKTTFLEGLIPALTRRGINVACVKHDAHGFQLDQPGKDTWKLRRAGADPVAILGPGQWAVQGRGELTPEDLRPLFPDAGLILCEGFKHCPLPKIEVYRNANGKSFLTRDETLLAAVTDTPLDTPAPQLGLEDFEACADLLQKTFQLN